MELIVRTQQGRDWRVTGATTVRNKAGDDVEVALLTRPCKLCGEDFTVVQKLPRYALRRFERARLRPQLTRYTTASDHTIRYGPPRPVVVKLTSRYGGLQIVTCELHRGLHALPINEQIEALV